eukprot:966105_1
MDGCYTCAAQHTNSSRKSAVSRKFHRVPYTARRITNKLLCASLKNSNGNTMVSRKLYRPTCLVLSGRHFGRGSPPAAVVSVFESEFIKSKRHQMCTAARLNS